jgi:hypothetical protein
VDISPTLAVALLGVSATFVGYFVSNALERRRALSLREMEFRLDRYKEFLLAYTELSVNRTYATQLRFVNSVNVILMIGSAELLLAVNELIGNYNDEQGSEENQQPIMDRILLGMRHDLNAADSKRLAHFRFPIIIPDIEPDPENSRGPEEVAPKGGGSAPDFVGGKCAP